MIKLKPEVTEKWLAALRSGKYKQGRKTLRSDEGYCCLGVLCDVLIKDGTVNASWSVNEFVEELGIIPLLRRTVPPKAIVEQIATCGIHDVLILEMWDIEDSDGSSLMDLNDRGISFAEIADVIEKEQQNHD